MVMKFSKTMKARENQDRRDEITRRNAGQMHTSQSFKDGFVQLNQRLRRSRLFSATKPHCHTEHSNTDIDQMRRIETWELSREQ